jgi:Ni/Fe-hydrogenase subunit HybB-like protein
MAGNEHARVEGPLITKATVILSVIVFAAFVVLLQRFIFGLGAVTNLNDGYPWGIWIAIDLITGTALGCGGLVTAFLVYILNKGEYHPLARAGLLTSLFGYTLGGLAVMIDLGRWWQGYNMMLPWLWNTNSVLLETALCISIYIIVLSIELVPSVLERFGMAESRRKVHRVMFFFTGLGCLLPMMHQSSMGTVVVLLGHQLSPLWQSPMLTVNFLLTAFSMGFAIVAFEAVLSSAAFKRPFEHRILAQLSGVMVWMMVFFIVVRTGDTFLFRGGAAYAFAPTVQAVSFWAEILLGIAAIACLMPQRNRWSMRYVFLGAAAMLLNGGVYRINCYLVGYDPGPGWHYFPSAGEIMVTVGIFSLEVLLYIIAVKQLPILHAVHSSEPATAKTKQTSKA